MQYKHKMEANRTL